LRSRDRRHRHHLDLDFGAGLVGIDLQEHITDTNRRPLAMGDDNLDLLHVAIIVGTHGGWHQISVCTARSFDGMPPELVRTHVGMCGRLAANP
jgi:hypothetical protein